MMDSEKCNNVLTKKGTTKMAKRFPEGLGVFLAGFNILPYFGLNNISVLDWPGNSTDLNLIKNLWSIIKLQLRRKDCITMVKQIKLIIECSYRDPQIQDTCKIFVVSMPKRLKIVLNCHGGLIRY